MPPIEYDQGSVEINVDSSVIELTGSENNITIYGNAPDINVIQETQTLTVIEPNTLTVNTSDQSGENPHFDSSPDTTTISGIATIRGISRVDLSWIELSVPKHHHRTEVWRNTIDNVNGAVCVGDSRTQTLTDTVEPQESYFYWIRPVSFMGNGGDYSDSVSVSASTNTALKTFLELDALLAQVTQIDLDLQNQMAARNTYIDGVLASNLSEAITLVNESIATVNANLVSVQNTLALTNTTSYAGIQDQIDIVISDNAARATELTTLTTRVATEESVRSAAVSTLTASVADANSAMATLQTALEADISTQDTTLRSLITTESNARVAEGITLATNISSLDSRITDEVADRQAAILSEQTTRVTNDSALSSRIDTVETDFVTAETTLNARITSEVAALTTADSATATAVSDLETSVNGELATTNSNINNTLTTITNEQSALASSVTTLDASFDGFESGLNSTNAALTSESTSRADADSALSQQHTDYVAAAAILIDDAETNAVASAQDYTTSRVGYCVINNAITDDLDRDTCEANLGTWVNLPLSQALDKVTVDLTMPDGSTTSASAYDMYQVLGDDTGNLRARSFLGVDVDGRITGIVATDTSGNETSSNVDILGDKVNLLNPNSLAPFVSFDTNNNRAIIRGQLILDDGTTINQEDDIRGRDAITTFIRSDNGYAFRNNSGSNKTLTAYVYFGGDESADYTGYQYTWRTGNQIAAVSPTGDFVGTVPGAGNKLADGTDPAQFNFRSIVIDPEDVPDGDLLAISCTVSNII